MSWERGYDFHTSGVITVKVNLNEFTKLESALKMLASDRIDFVVDYEQALNENIKELKLENKIRITPNAIKGPKYYMTFAKTEKSKPLIKIWDREMERLDKSGKLHELYTKYGDPTY